jgi:hypothetical protein
MRLSIDLTRYLHAMDARRAHTLHASRIHRVEGEAWMAESSGKERERERMCVCVKGEEDR